MKRDPVLEEMRRIKEEHAAQYNYDVFAMGKALQEGQKREGIQLVSPPRRKKAPTSQDPS